MRSFGISFDSVGCCARLISMRGSRKARVTRRPKAATKDIVGVSQSPKRVPAKWKRHYDRLLQLRDDILNSRVALTKDAIEENPTFSTHMADAGTDTFDRDLALGMLSTEQDAVYEIEQALDRIRNGSYATCELTGKPIEPARLEAVPWTRFSVGAENQLEAEGAARRRARLGRRQSVVKPDEQQTPEQGR